MAGRASIVGAAVTHVGNVREHNEDAHFLDAELGLFLVCDGMGGHAAGEVASAIAISTIRERWVDLDTMEVADVWLARGTAIAKKQLIGALRDGVIAAHEAILAEGVRDPSKQGMGTTLVAGIVIGNELIFAHCGDSRAYIVRDGIAMQLTEDHTLLQRLLAAGIDVDVSGDGARFRSMLTNALGIGQECKVSTFVVPLADGDRFMLCSDGISEYVQEHEVGEVLSKQPSPARAAQKLVELALDRGGSDNATAIVIRVLEAGETPVPAEQRRRDDLSISLCELWSSRVTPQQRLRALRIAIPRDHAPGERLPAYALGDRVAWILVEGEVTQDGETEGPGAFLYPESLVAGSHQPERDALAVARTEVRAVAIRNDDFRELCDDDAELGEALLESLAAVIAGRGTRPPRPRPVVDPLATTLEQEPTDPELSAIPRELPALSVASARAPAPAPGPGPARDVPMARAPTPPAVPVVVARKSSDHSEPEITISRDDSSPEIEILPASGSGRMRSRHPTEPEIETVVELEADLPRGRAITAEDAVAISGTIDHDDRDAAPRSKPPVRD